MKRFFSVILCICILASTVVQAAEVKEREFELWTQSPSVTCGLSDAEATVCKALQTNKAKLLPLTLIGDKYYLAVCEHKRTDGGDDNDTNTASFYFYTLYATDDGFIVLSSKTTRNEYYWDYGFSAASILNYLDSQYYSDNNSEVPYYILNPDGKYTDSDYKEYDEYFIITGNGNLYKMEEYADYGSEGYPYIKDKILYRGQNKYNSYSTTYVFYYLEDGVTKASNSTPMFFRNGTMSYGTATRVAVGDMTTANGYRMYTEDFESNISFPKYYPIPGSNNLFFTGKNERTYSSADGDYFYYHRITVYKNNNGIMTQVKSKVLPTKDKYGSSYTYQKINGITTSYYTSRGLPVPAVSIGTIGVIAKDGTICALELDKSKYDTYCYPCTYNGVYSIIRTCNGTGLIYKRDPSNDSYYYWQVINQITFDSAGKKTMSDDIELKVQSSKHSGQNGYFSYYKTFNAPNFTDITVSTSWFGRTRNNVFPDGRYVTALWQSTGSGVYELWYNIYNSDGSLRATGPTGYSGYFGSSLYAYDLITWAINDSKFIVCFEDIDSPFLMEYYRVAVVSENESGEVVSKAEIGEKNITPPEASDTEVVQSKIDFGSSDIPLGYNIKDNVIDTGKLDVILREQVNSIRLNDIVILVKEGYQGGEQNTGVTLSSYSVYEDSFGGAPVRIYTNGQYIRWYCNNPEDLFPGTYSKVITVGDKSLYVTFKVIQPPTNEGSTTVVF